MFKHQKQGSSGQKPLIQHNTPKKKRNLICKIQNNLILKQKITNLTGHACHINFQRDEKLKNT